MTQQVYCSTCGTKLAKRTRPIAFDPQTGDAIYEWYCPADPTVCARACEAKGGHQFGWFSSSCKRCKYVDAVMDI